MPLSLPKPHSPGDKDESSLRPSTACPAISPALGLERPSLVPGAMPASPLAERITERGAGGRVARLLHIRPHRSSVTGGSRSNCGRRVVLAESAFRLSAGLCWRASGPGWLGRETQRTLPPLARPSVALVDLVLEVFFSRINPCAKLLFCCIEAGNASSHRFPAILYHPSRLSRHIHDGRPRHLDRVPQLSTLPASSLAVLQSADVGWTSTMRGVPAGKQPKCTCVYYMNDIKYCIHDIE
jgi:hypothetical protein